MRLSVFFSLGLFSSAYAATADRGGRRACCKDLNNKLPGKVFFPDSEVYQTEGAEYYSLIAADQRPDCRFFPESADDVAAALRIFTKGGCEFAVCSGGHNPWSNMNNIDAPGITIDMSNLSSTAVSALDNGSSVAHVGPGARWGAVYDTLDTHNLTAVGGRATGVGVGGFLLGGGISYFNAQHGLAAQNVINYEIVLADGTIANVNASSQYSDLYVALNGGSTNFGIVTRYDIATYPLVPMWGGFRNYELSQQAALAQGSISYMEKQVDDVLAGGAIMSYSKPFNSSDVILAMLVAYFNGEGPLTDAFDDIINTPFIGEDTFSNFTDQQTLAALVDVRFAGGFRAMFSTITIEADVQFTQDIFEAAQRLMEPLESDDISWVASFQANGKAVWRRVAQQPNYLGVETERNFWVFVLVSYSLDAAQDEALIEWHRTTMDWIHQEAESRGFLTDWLYMNYARPDQPIYESFGRENHKALKKIKKKYDPHRVFDKLWPGGYKIQ